MRPLLFCAVVLFRKHEIAFTLHSKKISDLFKLKIICWLFLESIFYEKYYI